MDRKVQRIERQHGGGIRVMLTDGSVASYSSVADLPDELVALLGRMDAADGDDGGQSQGDRLEAARSAYRQRLEAAHQQGRLRHDPGHGLTGEAAYRARLEAAWQTPPPAKGKAGDHKHWDGV
jgi:hypothetical protein